MLGNRNLAEAVEFAENPEPRCPCILLLDTSGSMKGAPIAALQEGLQVFQSELMKDRLASLRVEVAIITFNSHVELAQDFVTPDRFVPPALAPGGLTCMGSGINMALDLLQARKQQYRENNIRYYRPWVFLITDGSPQGEPENAIQKAMQRIQEEESKKRLAFFAVGVEGADMDRLAQISPPTRAPLKLKGLNFSEMFVWLSASMQRVSQSKVESNEQVALPPPGWGTV